MAELVREKSYRLHGGGISFSTRAAAYRRIRRWVKTTKEEKKSRKEECEESR